MERRVHRHAHHLFCALCDLIPDSRNLRDHFRSRLCTADRQHCLALATIPAKANLCAGQLEHLFVLYLRGTPFLLLYRSSLLLPRVNTSVRLERHGLLLVNYVADERSLARANICDGSLPRPLLLNARIQIQKAPQEGKG